jgi:hypothetical protein
VVEKLFPASVSLMAEVDVDERVVAGFDGLFYQFHAGIMRAFATLLHITGRTGTDDILPRSLAAHASRDDVVQRQLAGREMFTAILASVLITSKNIAAVELYLGSWQPVVKKQSDNPWYCHMEIDRRNPVVPVRLEIAFELAHFTPTLEIVIRVSTLLE